MSMPISEIDGLAFVLLSRTKISIDNAFELSSLPQAPAGNTFDLFTPSGFNSTALFLTLLAFESLIELLTSALPCDLSIL